MSINTDYNFGNGDNAEYFELDSDDIESEMLLNEVEEDNSSEEEYVHPGGEVSRSPLPKMEPKEVETANKKGSKRDEVIKMNTRNHMIGMGILVGIVILTTVVLSVATFGGLGAVIGAIAFTLLAFGGGHLLVNYIFGPRQVLEEDKTGRDKKIDEIQDKRVESLTERFKDFDEKVNEKVVSESMSKDIKVMARESYSDLLDYLKDTKVEEGLANEILELHPNYESARYSKLDKTILQLKKDELLSEDQARVIKEKARSSYHEFKVFLKSCSIDEEVQCEIIEAHPKYDGSYYDLNDPY